MTTTLIRVWKLYITISRELEYPIEDGEDKQEFLKWANSSEGKRIIQKDFIKKLNCYSYPRTGDIEVEECELKEYEIKSTDTDPRV